MSTFSARMLLSEFIFADILYYKYNIYCFFHIIESLNDNNLHPLAVKPHVMLRFD